MRPCPEPRCPKLIGKSQRACPEHERDRESRKPDRIRGRRRQERNARLFRASPLCVICLARGITRAVDVWDHKVPLEQGGADDESNLQGLCEPCHKAKTADELRERLAGGGG